MYLAFAASIYKTQSYLNECVDGIIYLTFILNE